MFEKFNFSNDKINKYYQTAVKDLHLATSTKEPELVFYACYNLIVKVAMAVCAKNNLRVKSRTGHHVELISKLANYLKDQNIKSIADKMRSKRNRDLYDGGVATSQKEADFYLVFCRELIKSTTAYLFSDKLL